MTTMTSATSLRLVLKLDAVVTGLNGAAYLLAAGPLGDLLGLDVALLRGLGAFLLAFAALVWVIATRPTRPAVRFVIATNALWVLGSLVAAPSATETVGTVWIVLQAIVVALFAVLQFVTRPSL